MEIYQKIDALHLNFGCSIHEYEGGAGLPISYSDRLTEEINLLLNGCGLFDLKSCWLISLKGADAGLFLQGMVTSDVLSQKIGEVQPSLICSNKGKIKHHLEIIRSYENEWIVSCDPGEGRAVGTIFDNYHVREDFKLNLLNSGEMLRVDMLGPQVENSLTKLGYAGENHVWKYEGKTVLSVKFDLGKLPRFINLISKTVFQKIFEQILEQENVGLTGLEAFDEIRVLEGIPRSGEDYTEKNFPQEAGLGDHISFDKGCYIGQEPHARMYHRGHPNWLSVWLNFAEKINLRSGAELFCEGQQIGSISSTGSFSEDGICRGIAMIRHETAKGNKRLSLTIDGPPVIEFDALPNTIS